MSNLSKKMLFWHLLSKIDTLKYTEKKLEKKIKFIYYNIFGKKKK